MPGIAFPKLGYATGEGVILAWLKEVGESIEAGEALLEVALEKTVHVLEAEQEGVLLAAYAPPGAVVPEGEILGWIGRPDEKAPALQCRIVGWEPEVAPPPEAWQGAPSRIPPSPAHPEKIGKEHRAALKSQLRRVTAQRMAHSWREAPKVDLFAEIDFTAVAGHRRALKAEGAEAPSYNVYIAHAVAKAFADLPELNRRLVGDELAPLESIDVGMAVALGDQLVTVSMKDLGGVGLQEVQRRFKALIRKALRLELHHEELWGSSLTVTNLGEFEVSAFCAVLNPPETYILAIGEISERPVVRDGALAVATMSTFCLSFDHRAVDGAPASRLLQRIKHHMEGEQGPL